MHSDTTDTAGDSHHQERQKRLAAMHWYCEHHEVSACMLVLVEERFLMY